MNIAAPMPDGPADAAPEEQTAPEAPDAEPVAAPRAPRAVPAARYDRLARAAARPVRVMLAGEFSVGKSTLANLLLGRDLAEAKVTATQAPAVWYSARAEKGMATLFGHDGAARPVPLEEAAVAAPADCALLRKAVPELEARGWDIIDTPGLSDPKLERDPLPLAAARADLLVWVTAAAQAWRRTEIEAFDRLPARLRARALLVATGADRMADKDLAKVMERLERETAGRFLSILPVAALPAQKARAANDAAGWKASGAVELFENIGALAALARDDRAAMLDLRVRAEEAPEAAPAPEAEVEDEAEAFAPEPTAAEAIEPVAPAGDAAFATEAETAAEAAPAPEPALGPAAEPVSGPAPEAPIPPRAPDGAAGPVIPIPGAEGASGTAASDQHISVNGAASVPDTGEQTKDPAIMSNMNISGLAEINGFVGACLVDSDTGLMLGTEGGAGFDLETAAAANTEVVKAKLRAMDALGLNESIEDILITLGSQYHLIRPLASTPTVFIYVALNKASANLGMARIQVKKVEGTLSL